MVTCLARLLPCVHAATSFTIARMPMPTIAVASAASINVKPARPVRRAPCRHVAAVAIKRDIGLDGRIGKSIAQFSATSPGIFAASATLHRIDGKSGRAQPDDDLSYGAATRVQQPAWTNADDHSVAIARHGRGEFVVSCTYFML